MIGIDPPMEIARIIRRPEPQEGVKQIRMNTNLSEKCLELIDLQKSEVGLFSGRTDFILSAIRALYFHLVKVEDSLIYDLNKKYPNYPARVIDNLREKVSSEIEGYKKAYNQICRDGSSVQVSFYISQNMREFLREVEDFSGQNTGMVIRSAVIYYLTQLEEDMNIRSKYVKSINNLYTRMYGEDES